MSSDPYGETNLFDEPHHESRIKDMEERVRRWQRQMGDTVELSTVNS